MDPTLEQSKFAATIGSLGGIKRKERLTPEQRSAIARLAAQSRWHPLETQAEREKVQAISQQINQLIQQAFKGNGQLPLV
jgi:hypothetical protein